MAVTTDPHPVPRVLLVAADHPALDGAVDAFVRRLRDEPRFFGPTAAANPKPAASLVARLGRRGDGIRTAAVSDGVVVGLAHVADDGDVAIAIDPDCRGAGVGSALLDVTVARARQGGHAVLTIRSTRRSRAAAALGRRAGFMVRECARGRVELVLDLHAVAESA